MSDAAQIWEEYKKAELARVEPILTRLGFKIDERQPHTFGERYLMHAVTTESGRKLILLGTRIADGARVVIKATSDMAGIREIQTERRAREALRAIRFAYQVFFSPAELLFTESNGVVIFVQEFIEQEQQFIDRPVEEQFRLALKAFKAQESAHAATYEHRRFVHRAFAEKESADYLAAFETFRTDIRELLPHDTGLGTALATASQTLRDDAETIEQYCGFLTHTDFVPHNFRIRGDDIYLLDHSSIRFGNKYEGWARFINFMVLYNPALEDALVTYVRDNRTPEESTSLRLMRIYRLGEIIYYYARAAAKSTGDLAKLNTARVAFWSQVLKELLRNERVSPEIIDTYKDVRDSLRSAEEKERQRGLH